MSVCRLREKYQKKKRIKKESGSREINRVDEREANSIIQCE